MDLIDFPGGRTLTPNIQTIHDRLIKVRGAAILHPCVDCGGIAMDWSKKHNTDGTFSEDYDPRCRHCHMVYDAPLRAASTAKLRHSHPCKPGCICDRHIMSGHRG